jgi:uncharacterized membrane protein
MLKLCCSHDSVQFILLKKKLHGLLSVTICVIFQFLTIFISIVGAVGAGAASRLSSGSDQMMRPLAAPAPQHW